MKRTFFIFAAFFILLVEGYFSFLSAGQVTLEISTTTRADAQSIAAEFTITNQGTEAAHDVFLLAKFKDKEQQVFIADRLGPGQSAKSETRFEVPRGLNGTYPLYIDVSYQHADSITVSSASLAEVIIGSAGKKSLVVKASRAGPSSPGTVLLQLENKNLDIERVSITGHGPGDLTIEPPVQEVTLQEGRGTAKFKAVNVSGNDGSSYGIFFAVEYDSKGLHSMASAKIPLTAESLDRPGSQDAETVKFVLLSVVLCLLLVLLLAIIISSRFRLLLFSRDAVPQLLDIGILIAVEMFIFSQFDLPSLFTATTTTGGDTASHYYTLEYLYNTLLPAGKISGWTMGNYAGFPILQFYFPLPFLLMSLLGLVMPLHVAFKLVTLLGTALLPVGAYTMMRSLRCSFPGPGIAAALMLPFLFNSANSMWGGNLLSTLAGEFSYSLSMALSLILIGSLYRGAHDNKGIIRNALLVFLVGFSHGYTLLFAEAMSIFLLLTAYGFTKRVFYLFRVYALGFCLLAFWLVPLLVYTKYTTSYHLVWTIHSIHEIVPPILLPVVLAGLIGSVILLVWSLINYRNDGARHLSILAYLWFGLAMAIVFFVAAPRIGVVDIRYVPYGQLMACLMTALFLGWAGQKLLNRWAFNWLLLILTTAATMLWTADRAGPVTGWSKWNYEGFEAKRAWPVYEEINKSLAGDFQDPRVVFEHSMDHNIFGSTRAFESLPLFAGRATLEGLYMQASISAPFIFYIQSMISRESSQPFPQYSYTVMDFDRARRYLRLFNVRDLIVKSASAKRMIRQTQGYDLASKVGRYEIWQLSSQPGRYVVPLAFEPVLYKGKESWKDVSFQWFAAGNNLDTNLVFETSASSENLLQLSISDLDDIPAVPIDKAACEVDEQIFQDEIIIETDCIGRPLLVKVSYHPNWQVEGAERIFLASPSFMLIYPDAKKIRLYYSKGGWEWFGLLLTIIGLLVLILNLPLSLQTKNSLWEKFNKGRSADELRLISFNPGPNVRRLLLVASLLIASGIIGFISHRTYVNEPYRVYSRSIRHKDAGRYGEARAGFAKFMDSYPLSGMAQESAYYIGITYYLEKKDTEAIKAFEAMLNRYPQSPRAPEALYHIGMSLFRSNSEQAGIKQMNLVIEKYPESSWARYAAERLQEHNPPPEELLKGLHINTLELYMGKAISLFNQDRLAEAKPLFSAIVERYPGFAGAPQAAAALALCYYKEGDCENTITFYKQLIERYPDSSLVPEAYFHIGLCHQKNGRKNQAEIAFKQASENYPETLYGKEARKKLIH